MRTRVRADENRKWLTFAAVRLRDLFPNAAPTDVSVFDQVKSCGPPGSRDSTSPCGARKVTPL